MKSYACVTPTNPLMMQHEMVNNWFMKVAAFGK